jgi:hypothetical protein
MPFQTSLFHFWIKVMKLVFITHHDAAKSPPSTAYYSSKFEETFFWPRFVLPSTGKESSSIQNFLSPPGPRYPSPIPAAISVCHALILCDVLIDFSSLSAQEVCGQQLWE